MSDDKDRLLSVKELADKLGRSRTYIFAMKSQGFLMPGNRASLRRALAFLVSCPFPRADGTKRNT